MLILGILIVGLELFDFGEKSSIGQIDSTSLLLLLQIGELWQVPFTFVVHLTQG